MMQPLNTESTASPASFARGFWRTALVVLAVAGALGGCSSTAGSARSSDRASQQPPQGASGVTVFGDIDVNVTRERTR
ncbi:hypothetical protein AcdelDRAFT_2559 [Acidovorax delafieldii 2AN]|uniref:Uncharacterized protein n=1 Tax=Acidovorax delafieldii 2AN TaxID=573060 RepID=C5T6M9_ACIDE|nr:hypothetical protein [Acidovorax delafieldii]EER59861.1 hypothetical protein AcdelDRAFT_2559 [Acidovorax delafieldii 2AN]